MSTASNTVTTPQAPPEYPKDIDIKVKIRVLSKETEDYYLSTDPVEGFVGDLATIIQEDSDGADKLVGYMDKTY